MKEIATALKGSAEAGVYVGRFNPMHLGHQRMVESVIEAFGKKHLILIGSCNHEVSHRHLFSYEDRVTFMRAVFPTANIAPLPDFEKDTSWFQALDDLMRLAGLDPLKTAHIGGSEEDVAFYIKNNRNIQIINRYSGKTINVSGSEIRDAIVEKRMPDIEKFLDPKIIPLVVDRSIIRLQELRSK